MSRFRKMPLPAPNRADSLWRGCIFAYCAGWEKGFKAGGSLQTACLENQLKGQGTWIGSLDENNYQEMEMGRVLDEGLSDDRMNFTDNNNKYDSTQVSAFVLTRPETIQNSEQTPFNKQDGPVPNSGWGITVSFGGDPQPNGWHFQLNDGAVREFSVANLQSTSRVDALVLTYDRVNLKGFVNGAIVGSVGATGPITLNNSSIALYGDGVQPNYQGHIGAAVAWNRPLSNAEVERLYADPYIMWRNDLHKEFMFGPGRAPVGGLGTYFLIF
jgi:hypothetical protein